MQRGDYRVSSLAYEKKRQGTSGIAARQRGGIINGLRGNPLRVGFPFAVQVVDPSHRVHLLNCDLYRRAAATNNPCLQLQLRQVEKRASVKRPRNHKFGFGDGHG